jgi:hypothetical protein
MKKRILMLLTVAALMVVMLAMSVAPGFARWESDGCRTDGFLYYHLGSGNQTLLRVDRNDDGYVCATLSKPNDPLSDYRYYENRDVV